jgi:hypothetical protein
MAIGKDRSTWNTVASTLSEGHSLLKIQRFGLGRDPSNNMSVNTDLIFRLTVKDSKNATGAADVKGPGMAKQFDLQKQICFSKIFLQNSLFFSLLNKLVPYSHEPPCSSFKIVAALS